MLQLAVQAQGNNGFLRGGGVKREGLEGSWHECADRI